MDLFKQLFLIKQVKGYNMNKNCFSPQSEPHSAKLCFSVDLSIFREIHRELPILVKKVTISENSTETLKKSSFFLTSL